MRDLKQDPAWSAEDLGFPLPDSPHACLVSLPTWDSVIGYEEGRADVVEKMRAGYPRFFVHPTTWAFLKDLERRVALAGERVMAYSSLSAAERGRAFVEKRTGALGRIEEVEGIATLAVPADSYRTARDYWRHTGEIVSSRQAEDFLNGVQASRTGVAEIRRAMAEVLGGAAEDCYIFESGMAAIYTLYRGVTARHPEKKTLQLCFPYVDALKIQEHFGSGVDFVGAHDAEGFRAALEAIQAGDYAAVFSEVPSNPLLHSIDLPAVSAACRKSDTPLLVDDTVCSHYNVDVLRCADAASTSLTKWVSGVGDVMAGSVKLNPESRLYAELREALDPEVPDGVRLYVRDAEVLVENARGFERRVEGANRSGEVVAQFLVDHPAIDGVWYPTVIDRDHYDALRTERGGYGGLMSFTLNRPERAPAVYEAMRFSKGPSLGTEYSLLCPYTLLAHYTELGWAADCGVARELLRLSVGLEPLEELLARLQDGLAHA